MEFNIAIEIGREYTDGFFSDETGYAEGVKVATNADNPMESLVSCIKQGAGRWGLASTGDLIKLSQVVKLSIPTIGENMLNKRTGHKLGLIVTHPFERNAYFPKRSRNPISGFLVGKDMVVGIEEEVNSAGQQVVAPSNYKVRDKVRYLLEFGASAIVISLKNAWVNRINEATIKDMIESDFPGHYLGAVPVFTSTDFSCEADDFLRTNNCVLNVYSWAQIADFLNKVETYLRDHEFKGTFLVAQADGMLARTTRVSPIKTFASDKATSTTAASVMNENYGFPYILNLRLGENTTTANLISQGPVYGYGIVDIAGIPVTFPGWESLSWEIGRNARVTVANDGIKLVRNKYKKHSACLGGAKKPTITDAYLTLGYFGPGYLLQGKETLSQEKAAEAITLDVAQPLGISAEEAAWQVLKTFERQISHDLLRFLGEKGVDSARLALLPSGVNSGIHACEIADRIKAATILYSPVNALLGAFGLDRMGIGYSYTSYFYQWISREAEPEDVKWFNSKVGELKRLADRDMKHSGVPSHSINFSLHVQVETEGKKAELQCPKLFLENKEDVNSLFEALSDKIKDAGEVAKMKINFAILNSSASAESRCYEMKGDSQKALIGEKEIYWEQAFQRVPVYRYEGLKSGEVIEQVALLTSRYDILIITDGKKLTIDQFAARITSKT